MFMSSEQLIKITSAGTIPIPKDFRRFLELQKGGYVKVLIDGDCMVVKKATIS
ncbi:MAG: AbrB family transcriptional regulator [Thaumarchaeota archaeon 13_1_40CM_2_39_13_2]|nr:MAG: AbrB family transcriptional regulator [Thaumarchaeota archaeon 13_1_40CM_2_39_13_2]OLE43873.1 MAG: AbrB family transcriptional regulator [Thaumarchaeota archaeon 13_1_20CM_2_39_11]